MKVLKLILFLVIIFLCIHLFAQENRSSPESHNELDKNRHEPNLPLNINGYILLSSGNYVCGEFGNNNLLYVIRDDTLFTLDVITLNETLIGEIAGINSGQIITTIGYSFNSEIMFLGTTSIGTSELYNLNLITANADFIGVIGQPGLTALDVDCSGNIYSIDIIDDMLWEINANTGTGSPIGALGIDVNFATHLDFDLEISALYLVAFNNSTFSSQLRTVDLANGSTTLITDLGGISVTVFAIEGDCGPGQALNPQPADSSINISVTLIETTWENPAGAIGNEIWWGTDPDDLVLVFSGGLFTNYSVPEILQYEQTYFWKVDEIGLNGFSQGKIWTFTTEDNPMIVSRDEIVPLEFFLEQNFPNPFNPNTKIKFTVPSVTLSEFEGSLVTLKVYDILGNEIATLVNEKKPTGEYEVEFDGSNLTSGIYLYQLKTGKFIQTKKMILLI